MRLRKRGCIGGGGDHGGAAAVLGAVGLGAFARLALTDPPEELPLSAAYEDASGCISVSLGGDAVSASRADLAAALELPPGAVGLTAGCDAAVFSSAEAIAAVAGSVRDCVMLGGGVDGVAASGEVAAALRLVEEGKAYEVDWGGLVWAVLKGEVVAGMPRRYAPYLLRLIEYQRPELLDELDGSLPLRKRWKNQMLQQCQWAGSSEENVVEEDEEEISLAYEMSPNIGDLEEMPIFGEGKEVPDAVPVDFKGTFLEGEEFHGVSLGHAELGSQSSLLSDAKIFGHHIGCDDGEGVVRGNVNNQSFSCDFSFQRNLHAMDGLDNSSSPQQFISRSQPAANLQRIIEIEDEGDEIDNVHVDHSLAAIRNVPLDISRYLVQQLRDTENINHGQILSPFNVCLQRILAGVHRLQNEYLNLEKERRDTQDEVQRLKEKLMEKELIIQATKSDIQKELEANNAEMYRLEWEREVMCSTVQKYKELVKKSSAEFREYMMLRGEIAHSCFGVSGSTCEPKRVWVQQVHNHCRWFEKTWSLASLNLYEKITKVAKGMADLDHELHRLKDSISIPDLNNGMGDGENVPSKSEERVWTREGDRVSSITQRGKHLGELIASPEQIKNTEESVDAIGVQGRCSEDGARRGGGSSQGTS